MNAWIWRKVTYDNGKWKRTNEPSQDSWSGGFCYMFGSKNIVFQQDNCRPHTSILTRQSLWELDWEIHMNPPTYICTYEVITTRCFSLWRMIWLLKNWLKKRDCPSFLLIRTRVSMKRHYEISFKMSTSSGKKMCTFDLKRKILTVLNKTVNLIKLFLLDLI